jgi:hypothetical protein
LEQAAANNLVSITKEGTCLENSSSYAPFLFLQAELLKTLSDILVHGGNSAVARRQAGLQLKNRLMSNDDAVRHQVQQRWLQMPEDVREYVKNNILGALGSEGYRPSAAAQCVQYVAMMELPLNLWPSLLQNLVGNVTNAASTEMCKEATLEAIGYICQGRRSDAFHFILGFQGFFKARQNLTAAHLSFKNTCYFCSH